MKVIKEALLTGERALFQSNNLTVIDSVFEDGESPLKESREIVLQNDIFRWKYPLWYCQNVIAENLTLLDTARSGIWYTQNILLKHCSIQAPKTFRKAEQIILEDVHFANAEETLWNCQDITINQVSANGNYFAMNSQNIKAKNLSIIGNYAFDGASNLEIEQAKIISKDAFWNCQNVTVKDSTIVGEYLGWNSRNITFINCTIESNQGFCYMDDVELINCKVIHTDLAFEYSTVKATITTKLDSVKNPQSCDLTVQGLDELILDDPVINPEKILIKDSKGARLYAQQNKEIK